jgi:predicted membrane protein
MEEVVLDPVFKGGKVDVSFGEVTLDLRHTTLADETVELNVSCVFAEVNMLIPEDWNVRIEKQLSFGSINDKRILSRKPIDMNKELVINIYCKFGGCLIK